MLKPLMLLSAAVFVAIAPASVSGRIAQEAAPAQAAAPAAQAPVKGPMAVDAKSPITPTTASQAEAKSIYNRDCALCHGDNGNGKTDVATSMNLTLGDWTDPKTLAAKQDGALFNMIRVGNSKMPGEDAGRAKDAVVWNIIYYIREFSKTQASAPAPATTTP
ncbi:MAG TPA: cytochrome c [Terracidiphilus sp.]